MAVEFEGYENFKLIGSGSYGTVYSAMHKGSGSQVAIKVFNTEMVNRKEMLHEIEVMYKCRNHPHVLGLRNVVYDSNHFPHPVMDLMNTNLGNLLQESCFTEAEVKFLTKQILEGLGHIHDNGNGWIHGDLRPENILVDERLNVRICDFGASSRIPFCVGGYLVRDPVAIRCRGMLQFMAPEALPDEYLERKHKHPTNGAAQDIWALGCTVVKLFTGRQLFPTSLYREPVYSEVFQGDFKENLAAFMPSASTQLIDLLAGLLEYNPAKRLTAEKALKHPFFSNRIQTHAGF